MKLNKIMIIAGIFNLCFISVNAMPSLESVTSINQNLEKLTDVTDKIQTLNESKALQDFYTRMSKKSEQDVLEAAGNSIRYPAQLKQEYDQSAGQLVHLIEKVISAKNDPDKSEACRSKLSSLEGQFTKIKQLVQEGASYTVSQPVSRAKAYLSVNQSMPLTLLASQISMIQLMTCR